MNKALPISAGIAAAACFATERAISCYAPNSPMADSLLWLQHGFFLCFALQVTLTAFLFFERPDHHLDGLSLTAMFTTIVLFIISIPLYNVIIRLCNFIVQISDHILP